MKLSQQVFTPSIEEIKKYHNKEDWKEKIDNDGLLITEL